MKFARDIMTAKPLCLKEGDKLENALEVFLKHTYRTLPVVNDSNQCLGIMTELALVKSFALLKQNPEQSSIKYYVHLLKEPLIVSPDTLVKDFMTKIISAGHTRLIVCTNDKKILGIISPRDILKLFGGKVLDKIAEEEQREMDIQRANKAFMEDFYKKINPENIFFKTFDEHQKMQLLFNSKGMIIALNKAFRTFFHFENADLDELKLEHLFSEDSYISLLKEMAKAKLEGKKEDFSLELLKNAKNLIPMNANLYYYKMENHALYLMEVSLN